MFALVAHTLVGSLAATSLPPVPPGVGRLRPGEPLEVVFPFDDPPPAFQLRVPRWATSLRVTTSGSSCDVDLFASYGTPPDPYAGVWDVSGESVWIEEELLVDVNGYEPLESGTWYFCVTPGSGEADLDEHATVSTTLLAEFLVPPEIELPPGTPVDLELDREQGLRAVLVPLVPEERRGERWRVEVFSRAADIDLLAGPEERRRTHTEPFALAESVLSWEPLVLEPEWLQEGLRLHVFAFPDLEVLDRIAVRALLSPAESPFRLAPEPRIPDGKAPAGVAEPFGNAVSSTVLITGPLGMGSGVVVSPSGLVITNAHVVVGARAKRDATTPGGLACGFTIDPRVPAYPDLMLELVDYREDLDLALLRIAGTLDGRPLPAGVRFPWVPLAPEGSARLGSTMYGLGYPMTGGSGSFVTVTLSRGVLSGFSLEREGQLYKIDAAVHSGTSGGACLDEEGRLLGVPSSSIADSNQAGGLGFVIPIATLPASWRDRIGG